MGKKRRKKEYSPWREIWNKYVGSTYLVRSEPGNIVIGAKPRGKVKGR